MKQALNTLFITTPGTWLSLRNNNVVVKIDGVEKNAVNIGILESILCFGQVNATFPLMGYCAEHGVNFAFFGENGKFVYAVYDSKGSYKISGNNLQIECYYWDDPNFTILKLDKDSLIVRHSYPDSEYDYQITYYKRLSFYSEDNSSNLDAEAQKFVGTWSFNRFFWYFAPDGKLYISQNEDVNQENYITEKEWSYDPVTRTMATTVFWNDINPTENYTWGNYNYSWSVLVKEDDFWTGKCLYASGNAATFKKVK